jgi:hypothetical protein
VQGKAKRSLYLVPDQDLPESSGDLADLVETEKETLHEKELKKSFEPMPGMSGPAPAVRSSKTRGNRKQK